MAESTRVARWARHGLWALPVYGVLTFLATLTHQPNAATEFDAYARYITTDRFLVSHLVGSIFGAAVGILGAVALAAYLAETRAGGRALLGMALIVAGFPFIVALFGAAAFAQPAIGEAHLAGQANADSFNDAVYGTTAIATGLVGILLYSAGGIVLGLAVRRSGQLPGVAGLLLAVAVPLISFVGLVIGEAQTIGAVCFTVGGVMICRAAAVHPSAAPAGPRAR